MLAAEALGAREAVVALGGASEIELASLSKAIDARARRRLDGRVRLRAVAAPNAFVAGEESALVRFLEGGPAKPTFGERPYERGYLVQNAETIAHLALVARFGPAWFRELGTRDEPGTALVTLTGAVGTRGVYEIALGTPLEDLLMQAGGPTEPLRAVLMGGYFGTWLDASTARGLRLLDADLFPHRASLGARAVVALPEGACGLVETARVAHYLARESAGQCGPCVHGLEAIAGSLDPARPPGASRPRTARPLGGADARARRVQAPRRLRPLRRKRARCLRRRGRAPPARPLQRRQPRNPPDQGARGVSRRLRVNPIACEAHGLCAELFPRITLDEWGYPIVDPTPITPSLERAREAGCRRLPGAGAASRTGEEGGLARARGRSAGARGRPPAPLAASAIARSLIVRALDCAECGCESEPDAAGWRAYLDDDGARGLFVA